MSSPNNSYILYALVDASGTVWTINDANQVAASGIGDITTSNVIQLAYVGGNIWQQNNTLRWWYKTTNPTGTTWLPKGGTMTSPLPTLPGAPTAVTAR